MVDSCRECESCLDGLEQYCESGPTGTYGAKDPRNGDAIAQGGYSSAVMVDRRCVVRVPGNLDPAAVAPCEWTVRCSSWACRPTPCRRSTPEP